MNGNTITNKYETNYITKTCMKNKNNDTWIIKENTHEAIISKEIYNKVQEIKKRKHKSKEISYNFLLKDLVYCGHCKMKYQYKLFKSADKKKYLYGSCGFKCSTVYKRPDKCKNKTFINEKNLNEIVVAETKKRLQLIEIDKETDKIIEMTKENSKENTELKQYKTEIERLERKKNILYKKKCENLITIHEFKTEYERVKEEINKKQTIAKQLEEKNKKNLNNKRIKEIIADFKNGVEFTNDIFKEIINRIEVYKDLKVEITFNL